MKIKYVIAIICFGYMTSVMALDYVEVIDVKARQRYPWNGLVDIDFELDSKATEPYQMKVTVFDNVGKTNLPVKTVYTEGVSFSQNPTMVKSDTSRIIWDASADLPNGFKCTNVLVTCQDERTIDNPKRYMIIDLSAGANATSYPVTYANCPPSGGWTEDYKLTKLVLRRIEPAVFFMGSPISETDRENNETFHKVRLTNPYYIGVFEITAKQFALICGGEGGDTQPVTKTLNVIRGFDMDYDDAVTLDSENKIFKVEQKKKESAYCWPNYSNVSATSFIGLLRTKTGLNFDLPTEAQWENACRAGSAKPLYLGLTNSVESASQIAGPKKIVDNHYIYVGNYIPNSFGLYDMCGNVGEWCLDVYEADLGDRYVVDPPGRNVTYTAIETMKQTKIWSSYTHYKGVTYSTGGGTKYGSWINISYGIPRVVRGLDSRVAARKSALTVNTSGEVFVEGMKYYTYEPFKAKYTNPEYGIRVALTIGE